MTRLAFLWLPVAIVMAVIWNASAMTSPPGPPGMPDWTLHGLAYLTLSVVSVRAFAGGAWTGVTTRALLSAWLLATAYGVIDEWHQYRMLPGRYSELRDLMADTVGAFVGAVAVKAWSMIAKRS